MDEQMRDFMVITENLIASETEVTPVIAETQVMPINTILDDLQDVVFKLRAFMESREGDLGLGVELGMQRAADMIEHIINRHGDCQGN